MKREIEDILQKYVDDYAFVSTEEYQSTRESLQRKDLYDSYDFLKPYQTMIMVVLAYPSKQVPYKKGFGKLSRYSYGTDYHLVFKERLDHIEKELKNLGLSTFASVDTGPVDERWAAHLSGLGMLGKNQFLIHKKYGGYVFLASILIDYSIEKDFRVLDTCGDCTLCIKACPTNALDGGFIKDRCISEVSQSKKELSMKEMKHINTLIYGCDICQVVCPKNKGIDYHIHKEFEPTGIEHVPLQDVIKMTNKDYYNLYKNNASSWRGPLIIKRNALCLLMNKKDTTSIPIIKESMVKYKDVMWYNNVARKVLKELEVK
jgi:epoxyqueuosine reductase